MNLIEVEKIATESHKGQKRWNGDDYITHPKRVAEQLEGEKLKSIALLHDVVEDTTVGLNDLQEKGVPQEVLDAVNILTKRPFENYTKYIVQIRKNQDAVKVKIADLKDNLKDLDKGSRKDKYELALYVLLNNSAPEVKE